MTFNPFTTTYFVKPFLYYTVIQKMSHFFFMSLYLTSHFLSDPAPAGRNRCAMVGQSQP